jgi:pimeloyl-ACP methyl ester carboxylesterase
MGAIIAEAAAEERPEVGAVALIDGCLPAGTGLPLPLTVMAIAGRRWYRSFRHDHEGAWRSLEPYYAVLQKLPAEDRAFLRARVIDRVTSARQEVSYFSTLRSMLWAWAFRSSALGRRMASWPGKIALIWGAEDRIVPLAQAEYFRSLRPDACLTVIEGAGHLPHQEQPEKTARSLLAFLRDCMVQ